MTAEQKRRKRVTELADRNVDAMVGENPARGRLVEAGLAGALEAECTALKEKWAARIASMQDLTKLDTMRETLERHDGGAATADDARM